MPFLSICEHGFTACEKTKNVVGRSWEDGQIAVVTGQLSCGNPPFALSYPAQVGSKTGLQMAVKFKLCTIRQGEVELIMRMV